MSKSVHRLRSSKFGSTTILIHVVAICTRIMSIACVCVLICLLSETRADDPSITTPLVESAPENGVSHYSPAVVEKAESILSKAGLKRSGKVIQSIETGDISRALSSLNRTTRELRLVSTEWKSAHEKISRIEQELKRLTLLDGEYNLQLARVAGVDTAANNRFVGLINATRTKKGLLQKEQMAAREVTAEKRAALDKAEAEFAGMVLAIRADYQDLHHKIESSMGDQKVQIAMRVISTNFKLSDDWSAAKILATLDKRIQRIEQQIFSESIPLRVEPNGSLHVNVVVGTKSASMVVDSGATLLSLPSKTAAELDIRVPVDAPRLNLILADGRTIPARRVTVKHVRVGQFEAENVDAAILDPSAIGSEPLLGMSFLSNFKFEINAAEKTLKMLRIATDEL